MVIGEKFIRVGMMTFGTKSRVEFHLNSYFDKETLIDAVSNVTFKDESTNTLSAIQFLENVMLQEENGDRLDVIDVAVFITDGKPTNKEEDVRKAAEHLKEKMRIIMIAIGVGDDVNDITLLDIASDADHAFHVSGFNSLPKLKRKIEQSLCDSSEGMYSYVTLCNTMKLIYY